jgi:circadian clock protein KaiC
LTELDQLLGGGLTWGTTTLSIGPAGAGKSSLAAQYAAAVAADGKHASLFLFDERLPIFVKRCDHLGMGMSALVAAGRVRLEYIELGEQSPGEFSHRASTRSTKRARQDDRR